MRFISKRHFHQSSAASQHSFSQHLSSIWSNVEKTNTNQLYSGSPKAISSISYYRLHARKDPNTREYFDQQLAQNLLASSSDPTSSSSSPFPQYIEVFPGDLVECSSRSGSYVLFGVVVAQFSSTSHVLVFGLDGQLQKIPATNIRLHISSVFDSNLVVKIFSNEILHSKSQKGPTNSTASRPNTNNLDTPLSSSIDSYESAFQKSDWDVPISSSIESYNNLLDKPKVSHSAHDAKFRLTLLSLLRLLIRASLERYERGGMRDAFSVVYAHASSSSVRTFSLDHLSTEALSVLRKLPDQNLNIRLKISAKLLEVTAKVATHFYVTNSPNNWYSFPSTVSTNQLTGNHSNLGNTKGDGDGKWLPIPAVAAQDSMFVQNDLGAHEWKLFGIYIQRLIIEKIQEVDPSFSLKYTTKSELLNYNMADLQLDEVTLDKFSRILGVLKRYIVYPHNDYEEIVKTILQTVYEGNNLPVPSALQHHQGFVTQSNILEPTSATVHKMLIDADLVSTKNAYLDSGLVLDYESKNIVDEFSDRISDLEKKSILDKDKIHFMESHKNWNVNNGGKTPVYAVHLDRDIETELKSSQLAFSVEDNLSTTGKIMLHIHVPNLASWYLPTSPIMSVGLQRARTAWLPEGIRRLFSGQVLRRASFTESSSLPGNDSEEPGVFRCLTFSVRVNPINPTKWGPTDVDISLTRISQNHVNFISLDDVSRIMKWDTDGDQSSVYSTNPQREEEAPLKTTSASDPIEDLDGEEIAYGLSNEDRLDIDLNNGTTSDMNITTDSEHEQPRILDDNPHKCFETNDEAQVLSVQLHKDMSLIRDILEHNYWKRMRNMDSVYETDIDEYGHLVKIGSKKTLDQKQDTHLPLLKSQKSRLQLNDTSFLISEAGLLVAEISAVFGAHNNVPLLYEKQDRIRDFDLGGKQNNSSSSSTELRDAAGLLTRAGRHLAASSPYLGPRETTTSPNYVHFGLGLIPGFVGVARPFDDMRHVINQWQLSSYLISKFINSANDTLRFDVVTSKKIPWRLLSSQELQLIHDTRLSPRAAALSQLETISQRYWTLQQLEREVLESSYYNSYDSFSHITTEKPTIDPNRRRSVLSSLPSLYNNGLRGMGFQHIFRCIVVSPKTSYPDFARAYCVELGFEVDIMLRSPQYIQNERSGHSISNIPSKRKAQRLFNFFDKVNRNSKYDSHFMEAENNLQNELEDQREGNKVITTPEEEFEYCQALLEKTYGGNFGNEVNNLDSNQSIKSEQRQQENIKEVGHYDQSYTVLKAGDRIISTSIVELDPTRGHLVLGI